MKAAKARGISRAHPWIPAFAGLTRKGKLASSLASVIPAQAGIHNHAGLWKEPKRQPVMDSRLRGNDGVGEEAPYRASPGNPALNAATFGLSQRTIYGCVGFRS